MVSVPVDGRPQYSLAEVVIGNADLGRAPMAGVEQVTPSGRYILAGSWPTPKANWMDGPSGPVAVPEVKAKSPASAIWPNLASSGTAA
jgi:hypothetical protein